MKLLSKLFPQKEFIGIHLGFNNSYITVGSCTQSSVKVEWQKVFSNTELVNYSKEGLERYFTEMFSFLPKELKKRHLPVQIALPDPLFKTQKLQFSNFPRSYKEQYSLVNWQLAKESHCRADHLSITWQMLNQSNQKQSIFSYGIDKIIIEAVSEAANNADLQITLINAASYYRYNLLGTEALNHSGALLSLEKDYWTLMFWDDSGELNHIHSSQREDKMDNHMSNIIAETERLVWSYIQKEGNIEQIYITAIGEERELLETQINQRLENKCKSLSIPNVSNVTFNDSGLVDLATILKI